MRTANLTDHSLISNLYSKFIEAIFDPETVPKQANLNVAKKVQYLS